MTTPDPSTALPRLRQLVLLVPDLQAGLEEVRAAFGFTRGTSDAAGMAELGFEHEVCSFADTFLEVCAPLGPDSHHARLVEKRGAMGYMVDVQVADLDAAVARAAEHDVAPLFVQDYRDARISQWHPKALGTLAELDQVDPPESWHDAPEVFENAATGVATDIVGAEIAVRDPGAVARAWSQLLGVEPTTPTSLILGPSTLRFSEGDTGLSVIDVAAADPARVGDTMTLCGVEFRFVEGAQA
jgi:hypothetical protein